MHAQIGELFVSSAVSCDTERLHICSTMRLASETMRGCTAIIVDTLAARENVRTQLNIQYNAEILRSQD